jgi:hypothetical protein
MQTGAGVVPVVIGGRPVVTGRDDVDERVEVNGREEVKAGVVPVTSTKQAVMDRRRVKNCEVGSTGLFKVMDKSVASM